MFDESVRRCRCSADCPVVQDVASLDDYTETTNNCALQPHKYLNNVLMLYCTSGKSIRSCLQLSDVYGYCDSDVRVRLPGLYHRLHLPLRRSPMNHAAERRRESRRMLRGAETTRKVSRRIFNNISTFFCGMHRHHPKHPQYQPQPQDGSPLSSRRPETLPQ